MGDEEARSRAPIHFLGLMVGLVGFAAATVEILNYFELKPRDLSTYASRALAEPQTAPAAPSPALEEGPPSAGGRPARLVLIVKNSGDTEALRKVLLMASRVAVRLVPEDSVSLITFVNGRHIWVFEDLPGDQARAGIDRRTTGLFAVARISVKAAIDEALERLKASPDSRRNSAVVVLSAGADETALRRRIDQARRDAGASQLVLVAADALGDDAN